MAGEAAEFLLSLTDSVTPNAIKIAEGLEKLSASQIKAASTAVKLDAQMARAQAMRAKAAADTAKAAEAAKKAGGDAGQAAEGVKSLGGELAGMAEGATSASGPVGKLQGFLGKLGPYGQAAAVAIGALTIAVTAVVGTLAAMAAAAIHVIELREELLATFGALAGGEAAGAKTLAMVQKLSTELPFATSKIAEWAKSLMSAGIQGKELESAIKAVASATALMGESGGAAAEDLIKRLAEGGEGAKAMLKAIQEGGPKSNKLLAAMGLQTKDLAAAMGMTPEAFAKATISAEQMNQAIQKALQKKGAGALENMVGDLATIIMKVKEGVMSLFTDLGPAVKPFMAALQKLFGEFSKGGSVINTLKPVVTAVMTTVFAWATRAVTAVRGLITAFTGTGKSTGILSGAIAVLKGGWAALVGIFKAVTTALAPVVAMLKLVFSNALVLNGLKTIFTVVAGAVVAVVVVIGALIGVIASIAGFVGGAIGALAGLASAAWGAAGAIVDGLVGGIDFGAFIEKMAGLARAGLDAFKGVFGIKSPSRVMLEHGEENIAGATATGVDRGAGQVDDAMARLGSGEPGKPSGKARGDGGGERHVHFHYTGPAAESDDFFTRASKWLEQQASEQPTGEATA